MGLVEVAVLNSLFSFEGKIKWSLVALDRWSSYTVRIVRELDWADSALVVLDKWWLQRWSFEQV